MNKATNKPKKPRNRVGSGALFGRRLTGLQKLCKLYGRMKCGDAMMAWDYVNNVALPESDLRKDKVRWAASERAKYGVVSNCGDQPRAGTEK